MAVTSKKIQTIDLRAERLTRTILWLSLPSIAESTLSTLVYLVNTVLVGWLNNPAALAAVGLSSTLLWATEGLFEGLSISTAAMVARFWGGEAFEEARKVAGQAITLGGLLAAGLMALLVPSAGLLLDVMGSEPDVIALGSIYIRIILATSPIGFTMSICNSIMRATGDTSRPMLISGAMNVWNVLAAYALIFGLGPIPQLGLLGAALATGSARVLGGILALTSLFSSRTRIHLQLEHLWRLDLTLIWRVVRISLPNIGETIISRAGYLVFVRIVTTLGTFAYAAHQIALRVESLAFMPSWGLAMAAAALVGQALGAKRPEIAESGIRRTLVIGNGAMAVVGVSFVLLAPAIVPLFGIQNTEVRELATLAIRIAALELLGLCTQMIIAGCLRGAGDTRTPMVVTLVGTLLFRVPATYLFTITLGAGLRGVWLATTLDWSMRAVITMLLYMRGTWKKTVI